MEPRDIQNRPAGRFAIGLITALSLTLVAFEWRSDARKVLAEPPPLPPEEGWEYPPVVLIERATVPEAPKPKPRQRAAELLIGDTPDTYTTAIDDPDLYGPGPGSDALIIPVTGTGDEVVIELFPWHGVEQRPYFRACLGSDREELDACTERRIEQHLRRHFVVPDNMRKEERTTVSMEVDEEGRIVRVLCAPKPSWSVQQEIERVIRSLPPMMPATQNGRPVRVVFQIPFRVARG